MVNAHCTNSAAQRKRSGSDGQVQLQADLNSKKACSGSKNNSGLTDAGVLKEPLSCWDDTDGHNTLLRRHSVHSDSSTPGNDISASRDGENCKTYSDERSLNTALPEVASDFRLNTVGGSFCVDLEGDPWPPPCPPIRDENRRRLAFSHRSLFNDRPDAYEGSYERLEFIGDSYAHFIVTRIISSRNPRWHEGIMTDIRALLVGNELFETFSRAYGFPERLRVCSGSRTLTNNPKIAADLFEAYLAAVALDSADGLQVAERWLFALVYPILRELETRYPPQNETLNAKAKLALMVKAYFGQSAVNHILYRLIEEESNRLWFITSCSLHGREIGRAGGKTKKESGGEAAIQAIELLEREQSQGTTARSAAIASSPGASSKPVKPDENPTRPPRRAPQGPLIGTLNGIRRTCSKYNELLAIVNQRQAQLKRE